MAPKMTQDVPKMAADGVLGASFGHPGWVLRPRCANVAPKRMSESRDPLQSHFVISTIPIMGPDGVRQTSDPGTFEPSQMGPSNLFYSLQSFL